MSYRYCRRCSRTKRCKFSILVRFLFGLDKPACCEVSQEQTERWTSPSFTAIEFEGTRAKNRPTPRTRTMRTDQPVAEVTYNGWLTVAHEFRPDLGMRSTDCCCQHLLDNTSPPTAVGISQRVETVEGVTNIPVAHEPSTADLETKTSEHCAQNTSSKASQKDVDVMKLILVAKQSESHLSDTRTSMYSTEAGKNKEQTRTTRSSQRSRNLKKGDAFCRSVGVRKSATSSSDSSSSEHQSESTSPACSITTSRRRRAATKTVSRSTVQADYCTANSPACLVKQLSLTCAIRTSHNSASPSVQVNDHERKNSEQLADSAGLGIAYSSSSRALKYITTAPTVHASVASAQSFKAAAEDSSSIGTNGTPKRSESQTNANSSPTRGLPSGNTFWNFCRWRLPATDFFVPYTHRRDHHTEVDASYIRACFQFDVVERMIEHQETVIDRRRRLIEHRSTALKQITSEMRSADGLPTPLDDDDDDYRWIAIEHEDVERHLEKVTGVQPSRLVGEIDEYLAALDPDQWIAEVSTMCVVDRSDSSLSDEDIAAMFGIKVRRPYSTTCL